MNVNEAWVFNCDYNGLSVIQSLGRRGVQVRALDSRRAIGTRSRFAKFFPVPDPMIDEQGFVKALWHLRAQIDVNPVLIPTNDHWADALSRHRDELSSAFHCCVSNSETISLLLDKELFGRWGQALSLPVPRVWSVEEALEEPELPYPVAVKANARRRAGQGAAWFRAADKLRFRICPDRPAMLAVLDEARSAKVPVFLQQVVNGRSDAMHSIGLYAREGKILGMVYGKKHRGFPPQFGDCVVGMASLAPQWAQDLAKSTIAELTYTGLAEFDVIIDSQTGEKYLIEINPRSWGWIGVSDPAGVPLPWLAYRNLALDKAPEEVELGCSNGEVVYYAKALADLQNTLLWYRFSDARDWVLSPRQWRATFKGKHGVFAEFSRDDLMLGLFASMHAIKMFLVRARRVLRGERF